MGRKYDMRLVDWIYPAKDSLQWQAVMNTNVSVSFSRTLLHSVELLL
jgi:hypothetical protein